MQWRAMVLEAAHLAYLQKFWIFGNQLADEIGTIECDLLKIVGLAPRARR